MFYCSIFPTNFQAETVMAPFARASSVFPSHTGASADPQQRRALLCPIPSTRDAGHPSILPRKRQRKEERTPFRYRGVGRKSRGRIKSLIPRPKAFQIRLRSQFNNWSTAISSRIKTGKCVMKTNCILWILEILRFSYTLESIFFLILIWGHLRVMPV